MSEKWRPFCLSLSVLTHWCWVTQICIRPTIPGNTVQIVVCKTLTIMCRDQWLGRISSVYQSDLIIGKEFLLVDFRKSYHFKWLKCPREAWERVVLTVSTLRPGEIGRHFPDNALESIFLNENVRISIKISLNFVPRGPITNIPALVRIMAWCRPGGKPLSEPMMVRLRTHICITQPQWVNNKDLFFQQRFAISERSQIRHFKFLWSR